MDAAEEMRAGLLEAVDPVAYGASRLSFIADEWQARFLRSTAPEISVCCSRQSGKSSTAAVKAVHVAKHKPDALVLIISPTQRQSGLLLRKARGLLRKAGADGELNSDSATTIELPNRSLIVSLPGNDDSIRGYSAPDLIIEDEAAFTTDATHDALVPMLAVSQGQLCLLSTPQGRAGHFFQAHCGEDTDYERITVTAFDCPRISRDWLEKQRRKNPARFSREFMCQFLESDSQFFTYAEIEAFFDTSLRPLFPDLFHASKVA
ncbi:MAG: terminase family protein [Aliidongia sp.]